MRAVQVKHAGGADQLYLGAYPTPVPGSREVLVRVMATALNRADLLQREGRYPPPSDASPILGLEMAGIVEEVGPGVSKWKPGDRVFGLLSGGGYAEYVVIHEDMAMPVPAVLAFEEAAAVPEAFMTAYQALFWLGNLQADHQVLIHAGASGVGTAAIQLVDAAGAQAIVTASALKLDACLDLGARVAIDYRKGPFAPDVRAATAGHGVDIILDFIGAAYWDQNLQVLAQDGRLIILALMGGGRVEQLDLRALFKQRAQVITSTLRSRSLAYKIRLTYDFAAFAMPRFEAGALKPVLDRTFDWEDVAEAHRYMEANRNIGKIVLSVGQA